MRAAHLLRLVALIALSESLSGSSWHSKEDVLRRSKRRWVLSTIDLGEDDPGPFPKELSRMFNDMAGEDHEFRISGRGVDLEPVNLFSIDPDTGIVYVHHSVDREAYELPFHIEFDIYSKRTGEKLDRELGFDVDVKDINDNPPTFRDTQITADVMENTPVGYLPVQLHVSDKDKKDTPNTEITLSVISQKPQEPKITVKMINDKLYQLFLSGCFDYDKSKRYDLVVQAKDDGTPSLSSSAAVTLNIIDKNNHPPTFKQKKYNGVVNESNLQDNILRVAVDDLDTPKTPGWRAKYFFIKGNEDGSYKIETDPDTNEGVLSVIKKKDFEVAAETILEIGVENEETLWACNKKTKHSPDSALITIKVKDVNDPPHFVKNPILVYGIEGEEPGKVLLTPKVHDPDSDISQIRFVMLEDPADWMSIDEKTGAIKAVKKMDRESPFVNGTDEYKIVIGAIDNGVPEATGTTTVKIHLRDINDNSPTLVNKGVVLCANKVNKVMVAAKDADVAPFSFPFTFSLGSDDESLKEQWKLDPAFGEECGLISQRILSYRNYSVPLEIRDQDNKIGYETVEVMVCDCGEKDVCGYKEPLSVKFGAPGIGMLFLGLLLFLLLLLLFKCECGHKAFKHMPMIQEEGNQTLMKYNQEGGLSECKTDPSLLLTPTSSSAVKDGLKKGDLQMSQMAPTMSNMYMYTDSYSPVQTLMNSNMTSMGMQHHRDTLRSHGAETLNSTWKTNRSGTIQGGSTGTSFNVLSNQYIADHIDRRMHMMDENPETHPRYQPHQYGYEGQGSKSQSLDGLSFSNLGDDSTYLNDLGPKFNMLGGICQQTLEERNIQL